MNSDRLITSRLKETLHTVRLIYELFNVEKGFIKAWFALLMQPLAQAHASIQTL